MILEIVVIVIAIYISRFLFTSEEYYETTPIQTDFEIDTSEYKHIFCYWNDARIPKLVNKCIEKMRRELPDWKLILLTDSNIHKLIPPEDLPRNIEQIHVQGRADFYRLYLIYKYGGLYMDATIIINDPKEINDIYALVREKKRPFLFEFPNHRFVVQQKSYPGIENWFIMAPPNDTFIGLWRDEFKRAIEQTLWVYSLDVYYKYTFSQSIVTALDNLYHTSYKCAQIVMQTEKIGNEYILTKNCRTTFYKFLGQCRRDTLIPKVSNNIKLTSEDRKSIETFYNLFMKVYFE